MRAAEAALRGLNKSEIAGKRIKLEPSRPGGARRKYCLLPHPFLLFNAYYISLMSVLCNLTVLDLVNSA